MHAEAEARPGRSAYVSRRVVTRLWACVFESCTKYISPFLLAKLASTMSLRLTTRIRRNHSSIQKSRWCIRHYETTKLITEETHGVTDYADDDDETAA